MAASRKPSTPTPVDNASKAPTQASPPSLRILKKGTCPTVSGKSDLTYNLGCDPSHALFIRVAAASGGAFWSRAWVPLKDIRQALGTGGPITAIRLMPLFRGQSVNTPGFLLAVLRAEWPIQLQEAHPLARPSGGKS